MRHFTNHSTPEPEVLLSRLTNVHPAGRDKWRATCPAHGSGKNQALSVALKGDKLLLHCFAGCSPDSVLAAVGLSWRDLYTGESRPWLAPGYYRPVAPEPTTPLEARERWQKWWDRAKPRHPLLKTYLRARGLSIEPPASLRLALWGEQPVMLARVEGPQGLAGMHLTLLKPDGSGRLEKKLAAGSKPLGGAIRLYPLETGKPLALTEGIETALAVHQATGWPVWACVSAIGLERVQLPAEAREVVICADHDKAGLEAANGLARRLLAESRKVRLATPPREGQDWLDAVGGVA
ncbi:toprim domain-containing protein [Meiothermus cerbereus]|uniref:Toprim domain-containing protein n=1 Tax=Meiothermus ruber TaxID=277 RepID=A0A7C3HHJ3_MEIRU